MRLPDIIAQNMNAMVWSDPPQICWCRSKVGSNEGEGNCDSWSLAKVNLNMEMQDWRLDRSAHVAISAASAPSPRAGRTPPQAAGPSPVQPQVPRVSSEFAHCKPRCRRVYPRRTLHEAPVTNPDVLMQAARGPFPIHTVYTRRCRRLTPCRRRRTAPRRRRSRRGTREQLPAALPHSKGKRRQSTLGTHGPRCFILAEPLCMSSICNPLCAYYEAGSDILRHLRVQRRTVKWGDAHVPACLQAMSAGQQQPALQLPQPTASAAPVMLPEGLDLSNLSALAAMLGVGSVSAPPAASGPGGALVTRQQIIPAYIQYLVPFNNDQDQRAAN